MEARVQRVLIWCGPAMIALWLGAFLWVAGFIPPSDPAASAEHIVRLYADNPMGIHIGMAVSMLGSALLVPYAIAISGQLKRIDGAADVTRAMHDLGWILFMTVIRISCMTWAVHRNLKRQVAAI